MSDFLPSLLLAGSGILTWVLPTGSPSSCSALVALLILMVMVSGVLLWLYLKSRCTGAGQAAGGSPHLSSRPLSLYINPLMQHRLGVQWLPNQQLYVLTFICSLQPLNVPGSEVPLQCPSRLQEPSTIQLKDNSTRMLIQRQLSSSEKMLSCDAGTIPSAEAALSAHIVGSSAKLIPLFLLHLIFQSKCFFP